MADGINIRFGWVTNVDDPTGAGRIQVRTKYDNFNGNDEDLQYYFPLLPKVFHVKPKKDELVILFTMASSEFEVTNYYIGPIISQPQKIKHEFYTDAQKITDRSPFGYEPNPEYEQGVLPTLYPGNDDICMDSRGNTGIQLKNNEVRIKSGVRILTDKGFVNNTENPAFISLKYYPDNTYGDYGEGFKSTATIVADKINLLGANSEDPDTKNIPVTHNEDNEAEDKDNLISDSAMQELVRKAHQIPYGDKLVEFLTDLRDALATHVHPFPTMAPCNDEKMKKVASYNFDNMLSDIVRIN